MKELNLYSISDDYIQYLQLYVPNVYSNKINTRIHTRKYVGIVLEFENYNYYVPLSSPKSTDYQIAGDDKVIKKSIIPIIRIVVKNNKGKKELKGTLRLSHMIPVPKSELKLFSMEEENDEFYKKRMQGEMIFIRKNKNKILSNAKLMYKQKIENDPTAGYVKSALDYKKLESLCDQYKVTNE